MKAIKILSYLEAIALYFPDSQVVCYGQADVYENIVWQQGTELPSKDTLDGLILAKAKEDQIEALSDACQVQIISGFESNALGYNCIYDSEEVDQLNLIGSVTNISPTLAAPEGFTTHYANRPVVNGVIQPKIYTEHTYNQLRQVMADGVQFKLGCLIKFNTKRYIVSNNCSTIQEVLSITWDSIEG